MPIVIPLKAAGEQLVVVELCGPDGKSVLGSTTLEFKISFVRPITPDTGLIKAEGTVINCGRRVGTAEGRITDGKGRLLVHGTTTCLILAS